MIKSLQEANKILSEFVPNTKKLGAYKLDRMHQLMSLLDSPQNKLRVIHIAGTAGKTSTTYYVASLLSVAGKKVGHTVSPHIDSVTERVQIGMLPLPDDKFCGYLDEFLKIPGVLELELTYFEVLVGFAYWVFWKEGVDYAVVEVGLGGLLDGTNVVSRADKVCVITDIDFDHTNVLGDTLPQIAEQKAGIITAGNEGFVLRQDKQIIDVLKERSQQNSAKLNILGQENEVGSSLPVYQQRNFFLAKKVFLYLANRDQVSGLSTKQINKAKNTVIPGRMEELRTGSHKVILDGAHNPSKFKMLVRSLGPGKVTFIIGMVEAKKLYLPEIIEIIEPVAGLVVCTKGFDQQDLPHQPLDPEIIAKECEKNGISATVESSSKYALEIAKKTGTSTIVVTGSLYLLGSFRRIIRTND